MKRTALFLILSSFPLITLGQSVLIKPSGDEIVVQTYGPSGSSFIGKNADGTFLEPKPTVANTAITFLGARGYEGVLYPTTSQGLIGIYANQTFDKSAWGTHIRFETTADNTTSRLERMRIAHNGNVGIGGYNPLSKLHVMNGSIEATPVANTMFTLENTATTNLSILSGSLNNTYSGAIVFGSKLGNAKGLIKFTPALNQMDFATNGVNRMTISETGNVGIGTTSPTATLQTHGTFALSSKVLLSGAGVVTTSILSTSSIYKFIGGGTFNLQGVSEGTDGQILYLYAQNNTSIVLKHNDTTTTRKQITTNTSSDLTISNGGGATLIYDADSGYWRVIGVAQ